MTKQKSDDPLPAVRTTMRTTDPVRETGNQDMIYWPWAARIRQIIASFFSEKAKGLHESPGAETKATLTITEQIYLLEQLEHMDHGYGTPACPHRAIDELLRPAGKEAKDAKFRRPDEPSDQSNDRST